MQTDKRVGDDQQITREVEEERKKRTDKECILQDYAIPYNNVIREREQTHFYSRDYVDIT